MPPETIAVSSALGRVLAEAVESDRRLPPADNSAMDGYAVRRADVAGASTERSIELPIAYTIPAGGDASRPLEPGEAARILTGAPVPPGADAVVRQEDTESDGERVRVLVSPSPRENIRDAGEDVQRGDRVIESGAVIGPGHVGMLASLGRSVVAVHQRPRVALLSTGDELVEPDQSVDGGRIVSSNSYSLAAQCRAVGADPVYLGIARDTPEDVEQCFRAGLGADVLVSSAGVSVGDYDFVRDVLEKIGCGVIFWGVQIKPGYPLVFGRIEGGPLVFGLPGNPVSAMMTFEQFVRPALRKLTGHHKLFRPTVRARLAETLTKKPGRLHFVRVELERSGGDIVARGAGNQSSGALRSMTRAQGLLVFPSEDTELAEGAFATVQVLDDEFFASEEPGF
ncbi:MAG: molybdopterin molybdotransferase MoeA [Deltaproteobacteria bacterium]|nr:molybdopterin molybdotransferase MoeA [Deltaproteobacteria bacterium]MBW2397754.1 molybdopterin molybdotransferase MoeA [Deltaproteobacteria bacterium]